MKLKTFYWHDYETWGVSPAFDRPSQFAGVRTDEQLNIIDEPLVVFCQPCEDILPNPEACLVTGITPQKALTEGVPEREFIEQIHRQLSQPKTCGVGYNSIRFDDEVTRYSLYRNFFDPYEREWRNGNSRWDIIDMVRLVYALRPEGIEWPVVDGKPSFKLENLTVANGITHAAAHDAYSDVEATINIARLIKTKKPALYDYVYGLKSKQSVGKLIDIKSRKPLLHISSMFPSERGCAGLIVPLAMHPKNKNAVIAYDLSVDPTPLATLSAEQIRERVFTAQVDLPEGQERIPIKLIHLNKSPVLATPKLLDSAASERLGIDKKACEKHWQLLLQFDVEKKLRDMYLLDDFKGHSDPEANLYSGFLSDSDKHLCTQIRQLNVTDLGDAHFIFEDARLNEMFSRYRARNAFDYMSAESQRDWLGYVKDKLFVDYSHERPDGQLNYKTFTQRLDALREEGALGADKLAVLDALQQYGETIAQKFG